MNELIELLFEKVKEKKLSQKDFLFLLIKESSNRWGVLSPAVFYNYNIKDLRDLEKFINENYLKTPWEEKINLGKNILFKNLYL